jgi:hypothetical protein
MDSGSTLRATLGEIELTNETGSLTILAAFPELSKDISQQLNGLLHILILADVRFVGRKSVWSRKVCP